MTDLEKEYMRAYHNYLGAQDDLAMIRDTYERAAMAYFQSLKENTKTVKVAMFRTDTCGKNFAIFTEPQWLDQAITWARVSEWVEVVYEDKS